MGDDDLPFPPLPLPFLFLSAWDFGEGVGRTEAASPFVLALGFPLGGSPADEAAAASSFFVLVGAAVFYGVFQGWCSLVRGQ